MRARNYNRTNLLIAAMAMTLAGSLVATAAPSLADGNGTNPSTPSKNDVQRAQQRVQDDKRSVAAIQQDLAAAQTQVMQVSTAAEVATEKYDAARWHLQVATKQADRAERAATAAEAKVAAQRAEIGRLVVLNYTNATQLSQVSSYLRSDGITDLVDSWSTYQSVGSTMNARYDRYLADRKAAREARTVAAAAKKKAAALAADAQKQQQAAAAAVASAQVQAQAVSTRKAHLVRELAKAQGISVSLASKRQKALELEAIRKRIEDERKKHEQQQGGGNGGSGGTGSTPKPTPSPNPAPAPDPTPTPAPDPGPTSSGAAAAIAYAKAQLGKPYVWGAAGPNSFDCSGLTMRAWQAGGHSLPHYSAGQYSVTTPISVGQLKPGDLVFWGSSPGSIHHVAMYLGDGMIIHAPRTGRNVSIDSMYYWIAPSYFSRV